jgi:hypothetical protein
MDAATAPRPRWLWPWLHAAGILLAIVYLVLWHVELYLYIFAVFGGGIAFFGAFAGAVLIRLARRRRPWIDAPALRLLTAMVAVHLAAITMLRTVNWC